MKSSKLLPRASAVDHQLPVHDALSGFGHFLPRYPGVITADLHAFFAVSLRH